MYSEQIPSMIFTPVKPLPEVLGKPRHRDEVLKQIYENSEAQMNFERLTREEQQAFLEFCIGNRSLKITYEPFFQKILNPVKYPERLNRFLSQVLGQQVAIKGILPREGIRLSGESSLVVMDLLVELEDGSLVNVEMQKIGYKFPVERTFCYGADLLVRQYDRIHAKCGKDFSYRSMRPVYVIILMEHSLAGFHHYPDTYIHRSCFQLDSGMSMNSLMNFIYIPLDIFIKMPHNELTELEAWLYFLGSDHPRDILRIIEKYPFFQELYRDIVDFRYHPEELVRMYSEALLAADRNTIKLMIDEYRQELAEVEAALAENKAALAENKAALAENEAALAENEAALAKNKAALNERDAEIERLKAILNKNGISVTEESKCFE